MNLYLIHVGFYDDMCGIYELHCNMMVVAPNVKTAKQITMDKEFFINKKMHIDGIEEISNIDGYDIIVSKNNKKYQINKTFDHNQVKAL